MEFVNYNANPKQLRTGDCIIRAISFALNKDYIETYKELVEIGISKCDLINHKRVYELYLKNQGLDKQRMPRKDNSRYTIEEFINEKAEANKTYIISISKHLTVVVDKVLYDIWNCRSKKVGNYFELNTSVPVNQRELVKQKVRRNDGKRN